MSRGIRCLARRSEFVGRLTRYLIKRVEWLVLLKGKEEQREQKEENEEESNIAFGRRERYILFIVGRYGDDVQEQANVFRLYRKRKWPMTRWLIP